MKSRKAILKLLTFLLMAFFMPHLAWADLCPASLESIPVLSGGRVRALGLHARERIKFITGKSTFEDKTPTETFCLMSLGTLLVSEVSLATSLPISVNHIETRRFLKIPEDQKSISLADGMKRLDDMRQYASVLKGRGENTPFVKDFNAVIMRITMSQDITSGHDWMVPGFHGNSENSGESKDVEWIPMSKWLSQEENGKDANAIASSLTQIANAYQKIAGDRYLLEMTYDRLHLFHWAILAALVGLGITATLGNPRHVAVLTAVAAVFILEVIAVALRVAVSGRAPVTNMYETVMWAGLSGLLISAILAVLRREKIFLMSGLVLDLCCLFLMTFATDMLDPAIRPLVPVLRDNFWLSTHVTSVTLSYAAFALSWLLANTYMIRAPFTQNDAAFTRRITGLCYDAIKVGVVFLALGIILGGIWADYSWGRFWGWDPKETWSLIALMTYMAILHGRLAGWIPPKRFVPLVALAFLSIIMTWFGVNYVLAAGLHSYGFSEGGTLFLAGLAATQIIIIAGYLIFNERPVFG